MENKTKAENLIANIKDLDLVLFVTRSETPLFSSITNIGHYYNIEETTGINWRATVSLRVNHQVLYLASAVPQLTTLVIKKCAENPSYLSQLVDKTHQYVEIQQQTAINCRKLTKPEQLLPAFTEYIKTALNANCFLTIFISCEKILTENVKKLLAQHVKDQSKLEEYFSILCLPEKENEHYREEISFLNLCKLAQTNNKNLEINLEKHVTQFSWIGARNLWDAAWTAQDVKNRITAFLESGKNPEKELLYLREIKKQTHEQQEKIEKELHVVKGEELYKFIQLSREYAFLRTYRTDMIHGSGYIVKPLLDAIAKYLKITYLELILMSLTEVQQSLEAKKLIITSDELAERQKEFGSIFFEGIYCVVSGKDLQELKKIVEQKLSVPKANEVKGNIAFRGKVTGIAKIVRTSFEIEKVQPGDILIAQMTFPNYVPAMEKAAAFVTDEGGILCHAAIIAREMQKPCVIATKIATKIFHDGDYIEVDADVGIVKKIEKS